MAARNQLAVWLAHRQQIHLSMAGRSSLARALGLAPEPSPSLAPLLSRTVHVRRRRRFLPARVSADVRPPKPDLPQSEPEIEFPDVVDEEIIVETVVDEPETLQDLPVEPLADLPGLRALMRSILPQPAPAGERPHSSPAIPVSSRPADITSPGEIVDAVAVPGQVTFNDVVSTSEPEVTAPAPESQPASIALGATYPVPEEETLTPPLPEAPEVAEAPEHFTPEQLAGEQPFTLEEAPVGPVETAVPSPSEASGQQDETPPFSPQYWLERLEQVERREFQAAPIRQVVTDEPVRGIPIVPESLPASTVRFLRPLVGVDPELAPVYREPPDTPIVSEAGADAIAVDDEIILAFDQRVDTPEGAGLLAHELTHVARRRAPRFVPPVVRPLPDVAGNDEEQIARQVESRVRQVARSEGSHLPARPDDQPATASQPVRQSASHHPEDVAAFGGLPAPWEPMPELFNRPQAPSGMTEGDSIWHHEINVPLQQPTAPVIHHAESGRPVEETLPSERPSAPQPPVEPDLDALSRQVYAVLRRRLLAEQRRAG